MIGIWVEFKQLKADNSVFPCMHFIQTILPLILFYYKMSEFITSSSVITTTRVTRFEQFYYLTSLKRKTAKQGAQLNAFSQWLIIIVKNCFIGHKKFNYIPFFYLFMGKREWSKLIKNIRRGKKKRRNLKR